MTCLFVNVRKIAHILREGTWKKACFLIDYSHHTTINRKDNRPWKNLAHENEKAISGAIKIGEKEIRTHLDGQVRQSVEDTLNALLNAEADAICQASRYQRSPDRQDMRAGSYNRKLLTKAGEVELQIPVGRRCHFAVGPLSSPTAVINQKTSSFSSCLVFNVRNFPDVIISFRFAHTAMHLLKMSMLLIRCASQYSTNITNREKTAWLSP